MMKYVLRVLFRTSRRLRALVLIIAVLTTAARSSGEPAHETSQKADLLNSAIQLTLNLAVKKDSSALVPPDAIKGSCYFQGSSCGGAEVSLYDPKGERVARQRIVGDSGFHFSGLDPKAKYRIQVDYPRYKATGSLAEVATGQLLFLTVQLP